MAHELTVRADKKVEFAFTGSRDNIWHGLGAELQEDASIEEWKTASGLDWEVFRSAINYQSMEGIHLYSDKHVLFRSDTKKPLSVVSDTYNIVQPGEVLEFFRDLTQLHGFKLNAAGSIFGGKRFWATANVGKTFEAVPGDDTYGQLLLTTSCDGSTSTIAKFCSTRTVCNNTLTVALGENSNRLVKKSHKTEWDASAVKIDLGLVDQAWETFSNNMKKLAQIEITEDFTTQYLQKKFYNPEVSAEDQTWGSIKKVAQVLDAIKNGAGAQYAQGTAYSLLQSVTNIYTHGTSAKQDPSRRFWNNSFGSGDELKSEVYADMLALTA